MLDPKAFIVFKCDQTLPNTNEWFNMRVSVSGWLLALVCTASLIIFGPSARASWSVSDFGSALTSLVLVFQIVLSIWVLCSLALLLVAQRSTLADKMSRRLTPAFVRTLLVASTSGLLVVAPAVADAAPTSHSSDAGRSDSGPSVAGLRLPDRPVTTAPLTNHDPASEAVTVQRGDTLWSIAEAKLTSTQLGRPVSIEQVADSVTRWYAANRRTIGPNPDLITPHMVLRAPQSEDHK